MFADGLQTVLVHTMMIYLKKPLPFNNTYQIEILKGQDLTEACPKEILFSIHDTIPINEIECCNNVLDFF